MEELAADDIHEEFYTSGNPLVGYLHRCRIALIRDLVNLHPPKSLLEVGCGDGFILEALADVVDRLTGVELSEIRVARAKERAPKAHVIQGDARALDFPDQSFDVTICSEVLEHTPQPELAVREIRRVTSSGGLVVVSVPNELNWRLGRAALLRFPIRIPDHVNRFSIGRLNRMFQARPMRTYCLPPFTRLFCLTYVLTYRGDDWHQSASMGHEQMPSTAQR